ncbi:hypothetical protein POX_b01945 [Penicillium oxalicum]|uniref:Uncharacterized protein n=1 Tax=Penicillium oxalicum (strain 114-2 / CGMCC 5302) TaxID=933388 RepID=S7ZKA7_PENO1|nr:hypothetical protein POX_b01945 [Penicillium oxalicum]EPS31070.1 hypothetical protein PDE_06024 [Penicillium oxalicum 114-2]KAI2791916.1 hypothetical protein POX_b01945 [Penicillium oxalicum]
MTTLNNDDLSSDPRTRVIRAYGEVGTHFGRSTCPEKSNAEIDSSEDGSGRNKTKSSVPLGQALHFGVENAHRLDDVLETKFCGWYDWLVVSRPFRLSLFPSVEPEVASGALHGGRAER